MYSLLLYLLEEGVSVQESKTIQSSDFTIKWGFVMNTYSLNIHANSTAINAPEHCATKIKLLGLVISLILFIIEIISFLNEGCFVVFKDKEFPKKIYDLEILLYCVQNI